MPTPVPCLLLFAACAVLRAQVAELSSSNPRYFATEPLGATTFYVADTEATGSELYYQVGVGVGTLIADIEPGPRSANPRNLTTLRDGFVIFSAETSAFGVELWASDGRVAGTVLLGDLNPLSSSSYPAHLTRVGSQVFFVADNGNQGRELWVTDGSAAGTRLVKDVFPGAAGSDPTELTHVNGALYFAADDGPASGAGRELWRSDGSAAGTVRVRDILPGIDGSVPGNLLAYGAQLLFVANDGVHGRELWRSDGTAAGTTLVRDIELGASDSTPTELTMGLQVLFTAYDSVRGRALWKTDGTAAGTVLVADISADNRDPRIRSITWCLLRHFFVAETPASGAELWVTDGTTAGTRLVHDIVPQGSSFPDSLIADGLNVYFTANDHVSGRELWRSDGTQAGTTMVPVTGLRPGPASSDPAWFHRRSSPLGRAPIMFTAENSNAGRELWGIEAGNPSLLHDLNQELPQPSQEITTLALGDGTVSTTLRYFFSQTPSQVGVLVISIPPAAFSLFPALRGQLRVALQSGAHLELPIAFENGGGVVRLPPLPGEYGGPPLAVQGVVLESGAQPLAASSNHVLAGGSAGDGTRSVVVRDGQYGDKTMRYRLPVVTRGPAGSAALGLVYRRFKAGPPDVFDETLLRVVPFPIAPEGDPFILEGNTELIPLNTTGRKSDILELRLYPAWPAAPGGGVMIWQTNC